MFLRKALLTLEGSARLSERAELGESSLFRPGRFAHGGLKYMKSAESPLTGGPHCSMAYHTPSRTNCWDVFLLPRGSSVKIFGFGGKEAPAPLLVALSPE